MDGKRIETRLEHRFGPDPADFLFVSYAWNDAETEATSRILEASVTPRAPPATSSVSQCRSATVAAPRAGATRALERSRRCSSVIRTPA